ncbi:unnamed protein product, partial [Symbiodinium sp. KB8]
ELPRYHIDEEVELDELDELETAVGSENADGEFMSDGEDEVPEEIPKWSHAVEDGPPKLDEGELEKVDGVSRQKEIERLTEMKVLKEMPEGLFVSSDGYTLGSIDVGDAYLMVEQDEPTVVEVDGRYLEEFGLKSDDGLPALFFKRPERGFQATEDGNVEITMNPKYIEGELAASGKWTLEQYENEIKRLILEECRSIAATTAMERWLKEISREQFECPTKLKAVIKESNKERQDEETPEKKPNDDEAGSDPTSSSDSDDDKGEGTRASSSGKPEEDAERRKDELKKRLLQVKADENVAEQLQQQEADPQAQQMERRESELLDLRAAAQTRRRNIAKEAVKAQASVPSESSGSSDESEKEDEKNEREAAERAEEPKAAERAEEPKAAERAEEPKDAESVEESKEAEKAEESKDAKKAEEPKEAEMAEDSKDAEMEEGDPAEQLSIADVCRETYRLSENAIEMLLEEDKKESIRSALEMLESRVDQLPRGYGNHLERLSADFEKWTNDLLETRDATEDEVETNTIKRDGAKDARELVLTRKAEAELKKLEAENDIKAAEKEVEEYDEMLKNIEIERQKCKAGRQSVRETLQVSERVLTMLQSTVKQLHTATSINEDVKKNLFQDEEKKGIDPSKPDKSLVKAKKAKVDEKVIDIEAEEEKAEELYRRKFKCQAEYLYNAGHEEPEDEEKVKEWKRLYGAC